MLGDTHDVACLLCGEEAVRLPTSASSLSDGRRVAVCLSCAERLGRSFRLGTRAATAALTEVEAEKGEL